MKTHTLLSAAAVGLLIGSGAFAQSQRSEQRDPPGSKAERVQDTNTNAGQAQSQPGGNRELNGRNVRGVYPNNQGAQSPAAQNAPGQKQTGSSAQNERGPQPSQNTRTQGNTPQPAQQSAQPSNARQSAQPSTAQTPATAQQPSSQPSGTAQSPQQSNTSQQAQPAPSATTQQQNQQAQAPSATTQQQNQQARQPAGNRQQSVQQNDTRQNVSGVVSLSTKQQTRIGQTIARHKVQPVTNVNFSISVGTRVPRSVQLRALPSDLVTFLPQYRGYSYFVVEEQIVIVEPSSHEIMAVVPYAGSTRTAARSRGDAITSRPVRLDSGQRDVIRNHVTRERKPAERSAVKTRKHYSIGERVPRSVTIETLPETVYTEVPTVRRYRYFRNDDDVMLIDPDDDRIVEIIR